MNGFRKLLFLFIAGGLLVACGTKKSTPAGPKSFQQYTDLERVVENTRWEGSFSSKAKFNLQFGTEHYALSGSLRMKKDEALQLSFQVPILGMEAVRVEVTPEQIILIDRIHKKYVQESIAGLSALNTAGLDYYAIQSLLVGAVFRPGVHTFALPDAQFMSFEKDAEQGIARLRNREKGLDYTFDLLSGNDQLLLSRIGKPSTEYVCTWEYARHEQFAGRSFPMEIVASMKGISKEISLEIELSRFSSSDWEESTSIPSHYERIQLQDVMKMFSTL